MHNPPHPEHDIAPGMVLLLAAACGLIVANLYYAQTLVGPISAATGLSPAAAGLVVTLTQVGYTLGLLFVVPLGDLVENRRLVVGGLAFTALALLAASFASHAWAFLAAALAIGPTTRPCSAPSACSGPSRRWPWPARASGCRRPASPFSPWSAWPARWRPRWPGTWRTAATP